MTILVSVETMLLVLLVLLVAGLLRSHAEVLRRLGPEGADGTAPPATVPPPSGLAAPDRAAVRSPRSPAPAISGVTLDGDPLVFDPSGTAGRPVLLAFLSTGCGTCREFFAALGPETVTGTQTIIVAHGGDREQPSRLRELASSDVPLIMSSAAWEQYAVPGSPYFVLVDGTVRGEGVASTPTALASLVRDALDDAAIATAPLRARQVDEALAAAGLRPGDPSLYPGGRPEST
jgi:hypothetical protein